jgi:hypothetical protein
MVEREFIQRRQADIHPTDANIHRCKTRLRREMPQFFCGGSLARRAKAIGSFGSHEASKRFTHSAVVRPNAAPDTERETATMVEHATHFPQRGQLVRKKL